MEEDLQSESAGIIQKISIYKLPLLFGGGSVFVIALSLILLVKSIQSTKPIEFSTEKNEASGSALGVTSIMVDVEGAVVHPGLYSLAAGARVEDAIVAAGGLAKDVDEALFAKNINRASKIVDGAKLYIPRAGENQTSDNNGTSYNINSSLNGSSQNGALVNINFASQSELESLPGVGPVTAQKIIDNRPYQTLDELVAKKAIGTSLYEKIKNNLSL
jgi:competence protein ComEA